MKNEFTDWYNTKFNQLDQSPPADSWENISDELDVADVWKGVDSKLTSIARRKLFFRYASYTAALFLLMFGGYWLFNTKLKTTTAASIAQFPWVNNGSIISEQKSYVSDISPERKDNVSTNKLSSNTIINTSNKPITNNYKSKNEVAINNSTTSSPEKESAPSIPSVNESIGNQDILYSSIDNQNNSTISAPEIASIKSSAISVDNNEFTPMELVIPVANNFTTKHIIVGSLFTYSNTWLLNNATYNGLKQNSLNQTKASFGYEYGAFVGYELSSKLDIQGEWIINNKQSQSYVNYVEGRKSEKSIEINYTQFNLLVRKKHIISNRSNISTSFNSLAGLQYGNVKSISETVDGTVNSLNDSYRKNNYSMLLGLEYQLTIKHSLGIFTAIRADVGMRNLYAGTSKIPSYFDRTYNSSIGINVGINYYIPVKINK